MFFNPYLIYFHLYRTHVHSLFFLVLSCCLFEIGIGKNRVSRLFEKVKSAILAILFTCFEKAVELQQNNFLSGFLNLLRILIFSALIFSHYFASQSPPLSKESVVGYTYAAYKFLLAVMVVVFSLCCPPCEYDKSPQRFRYRLSHFSI